MSNKSYKVIIVEGEKDEGQVIDSFKRVFFKDEGNIKLIPLPIENNIYVLYKMLKEDDFETDIIELLREVLPEENLKGIKDVKRDLISEVYLFFDFDGHDNNVVNFKDVLEEMLVRFDNETENGKLYISYPMIEAFKDFKERDCEAFSKCIMSIEDGTSYKSLVSQNVKYNDLKHYDYEVWKEIINAFISRVECLFSIEGHMDYKYYQKEIYPLSIYVNEGKYITDGRVFVLSAIPEFLLDYFGFKLFNVTYKRKLRNCSNNYLIKK